jgi:hypothetical protein
MLAKWYFTYTLYLDIVMHPATGDPGDQVDAHTAGVPAPHQRYVLHPAPGTTGDQEVSQHHFIDEGGLPRPRVLDAPHHLIDGGGSCPGY